MADRDTADLAAALVAAGLLTPAEAYALPPEKLLALSRDPYALTSSPDPRLPSPALRWRWDAEDAQRFCSWVTAVLEARFDVGMTVTWEGGASGAPAFLRLRLGDRQEVCDWVYLNEARWLGAFGTIAGRLLGPRGVEALELETGDLDTVLLFCRSEAVQQVRDWLPVGE